VKNSGETEAMYGFLCIISFLPYMKKGDEQSPRMVRLHSMSLADSSMACSRVSSPLSTEKGHTHQALFQLNIPSTYGKASKLSGGKKNPGMKNTFLSAEYSYHLNQAYLSAQFLV
jgi:hypothetical protein